MIAILLALLAVVNTTNNSVSYTCNGVTATYSVNYPYLSSSDLTVTSTTVAGAVTTLTQTTDWSVNASSTSSTATLTLTNPAVKCPNTNVLKISRNRAFTQPYGFRAQSFYNQALHETAYDSLEMQIQQVNQTALSATNPTPTTVNNNSLVHGIAPEVTRTLLSSISDLVSVKTYGAVGDGSTDDTASLNVAVASGHSLFFPSGIYKITSTVTAQAQGSWVGEGSGNIFDSTGGSGISVIRCVGPLSPCVVAPREMRGLHFDGVNLTGTGVTLGADNGTFVAGIRWRAVTFRNFSIAVRAYNFFNTSWSDLVFQGNHEGIRIDPTVTTPDGGYFTSTDWKNIYVADNDVDGVLVHPALNVGTKTWTWENVVIERNGASGAFQALLQNVFLEASGLYVEGSSAVPGIKMNNVTFQFNNCYFNGSGGIDATSNTFRATLSSCQFTSATDVIAGLSSLSHMRVLDNTTLQSDPRAVIGGRAVVLQSSVGGNFISRQGNTVQTTLAYSASMSIDAKQGDIFIVTATDANAFTFTAIGGTQAQCIVVRVRNTSGGALGAVTWPASFKMSAWTSPSTGNSRSITLCGDGTNYVESSRTAADVPN